jgi:hypothetical protein
LGGKFVRERGKLRVERAELRVGGMMKNEGSSG